VALATGDLDNARLILGAVGGADRQIRGRREIRWTTIADQTPLVAASGAVHLSDRPCVRKSPLNYSRAAPRTIRRLSFAREEKLKTSTRELSCPS
jgi:hypothetical protein